MLLLLVLQALTSPKGIPSDAPSQVPAMHRCLEAAASLIKMPEDGALKGALGALACMAAHTGAAGTELLDLVPDLHWDVVLMRLSMFSMCIVVGRDPYIFPNLSLLTHAYAAMIAEEPDVVQRCIKRLWRLLLSDEAVAGRTFLAGVSFLLWLLTACDHSQLKCVLITLLTLAPYVRSSRCIVWAM